MPKGKSPPTSTDAQIGLRVRLTRIERGFSQEALAQELGVSFQQVQKYEKGVNRISLSRGMEIARVLKTTVNDMIGLAEDPITDVSFDRAAFKLSQSLLRLQQLAPAVASRIREQIDSTVAELERLTPKKKKR